MTKTDLIEIISDRANVHETEQQLFFEMLLIRIAEKLHDGESLIIPALGSFEYKKNLDVERNNLLIFTTTDDEELILSIPEKEDLLKVESVDSYFSISIGKPVIPLKGEKESFITQSGDERKRIIELKIERFIEDLSNSEIQIEKTNDIEDISFSFLNWKKSTDLNEEIYEIEEDIDDSLIQETESFVNDSETLIEKQFIPEEEINKIEDELNKESFAEEIKDTEVEDSFEYELSKEDVKNENEELIINEQNPEDKLSQTTEDLDDAIIEESKIFEKDLNKEIKKEFEPVLSDEKKEIEDDDSAVKDAFRFAQERKTRLGSYRKKSYGRIIFAAVIIVTAGIIYFSYYFTEREPIPLVLQNAEPKEFNIVIERTYDIPVSYPYKAGVFDGFYEAINEDILIQSLSEEPSAGNILETTGNETSNIPEIRSSEPSERIKGYIYRYNDGTYAVQVSSWKSRSIALSETQKFLDSGYPAFVEQTESSGSRYYRVRVGGFKSLDEAENFLKK